MGGKPFLPDQHEAIRRLDRLWHAVEFILKGRAALSSKAEPRAGKSLPSYPEKTGG